MLLENKVSKLWIRQIENIYGCSNTEKVSAAALKDPLAQMIELIKFEIRQNWTLNCVKSSVCVCMNAA